MYLDSAILVKLVIREPDSLFYADRIDGQAHVWSSQVAVTECWSALFRKLREGAIDVRVRRSAWEKLDRYFTGGSLGLIPVDRVLLERANRIIARCYPKVALRSLDAIHLASCEAAAAFPLLTNDRQMRVAAGHLKFPLGPLPNA
jgi:predicted nucleic acid-binding protein